MESIIVNNYQPTIYPKRNDGKQAIELYDSILDGRRQIISTPDKIDEFVAQKKKATGQMAIMSAAGCFIGAAIGAAIKSPNVTFKMLAGTIGAFFGATVGTFIGGTKINKTIQNFINENK